MRTGTLKIRPSSIVRRRGFTLAEILVVLAVVLVLISVSLRLGRYVRERGNVQLTRSLLAVLDTALQQYHTDFGAFPFVSTDANLDKMPNDYLAGNLESDVKSVTHATSAGVQDGTLDEPDGSNPPVSVNGASSAGLWWFLNRPANSRQIIDAITPSLITTLDRITNNRLTITITPPAIPADLGRFIDPWGTSLWYLYDPAADSFPRVISAGPDRVFGNTDDIENK